MRDYACGTQTYDGHTGQDSDIRSFREMDIGVPVFAVLDGEVISTQDGFYDREFGTPRSQFDNHIVIQHGPGNFTIYGHLRKGLTLRRGVKVVAGQQIGWTASSGNSSGPHLHFTSKVNDEVDEPFAGTCREGPSHWADQAATPTEPYARDLAVSAKPFRGRALLPHDKAVRTGTFVRGVRTIHARLEVGAAWNATPLRVRIGQPDGTVVLDVQRAVPTAHGRGHIYLSYRVDLGVTGRWRLRIEAGETVLTDAPLTVVASPSQIRNRRPNPVALQLLPEDPTAEDVLQCQVITSVVTQDPDYDIVRYRYRWTIDGRTVRTVTSAALSDVLRRGLVAGADRVGCSVQVSDGRLSWPSRTAAGTIRS